MDPIESVENNGTETTIANSHNDHGWQKVVYPKRQKKQKQADQAANAASAKLVPNGALANGDNVFGSLDKYGQARNLRIRAAQLAAESDVPNKPTHGRSGHGSSAYGYEENEYDDSDGEIAPGKENRKVEEAKKPKPKKEKKPKVTLAEEAAKIDASNLETFLVEISESYEAQPDIQLMRFADYFGRALSKVTSAQFPWIKMFKESPVSKVIDVPLSHISEAVYKTSVDWINHRPLEALGSFVLWAFDCILTDLAAQHGTSKGAKKGVHHTSSKSQAAIFVALAMVLRRKPDALTHVSTTLRENPKYQGQDKLPVIVWMMAQSSQGDLSVGLYSWAHNLLPVVSSKSCNPQSRDLILQLVEKILSNPKARTILVNGAVRKGERLIPPSSFELLVRLTFPSSSTRVKATERFEAIYPLLKEVALAGAPGSKAMKQVTQQIFNFSLKAAGEGMEDIFSEIFYFGRKMCGKVVILSCTGNPELSKEAASLAVWSLTQNVDCCKHWENLYKDNLEASVAVLKKLVNEWKEHSLKLTPADTLARTIQTFRQKNEEAIADGGADKARLPLYKDAEKCCKVISGRLSRGHGCLKATAFAVIGLAIAAAALSTNPEATAELKNLVETWDLKKITETFTAALSN